jgi:hypothetical protein
MAWVGYWVEDRANVFGFPVWQDSFYESKTARLALGLTLLYLTVIQEAGFEANHSPLFCAAIKNMWIYTSNSHMYSRYPQGQFCVFFL